MSLQSSNMEYANLGEYLRATRIGLGLDLFAVVQATKISTKNLQAIEDNNFTALPAEAFARGLYALYARMLGLDSAEILKRYMQEKPHRKKGRNRISRTSARAAEEVGSMAERPSFRPVSFLGMVLLLSLLLTSFLCWFFSWNPAIYLSQKLRSLDQAPQEFEMELQSRLDRDLRQTSTVLASWRDSLPINQRSWSGLTASTPDPEGNRPVTTLIVSTPTNPSLTIHPEGRSSDTGGDRLDARVGPVPGANWTRLTRYDPQVPLPPAERSRLNSSLPEYLLQ